MGNSVSLSAYLPSFDLSLILLFPTFTTYDRRCKTLAGYTGRYINPVPRNVLLASIKLLVWRDSFATLYNLKCHAK